MEFSIVEGKKLNSINYLSDGFRYVKYHENKGTISSMRSRIACGALAKVSISENLLNKNSMIIRLMNTIQKVFH